MNGDKDIARFKRDVKNLWKSLAKHIPGVGSAFGIHDTYKKGKRLTKSTPRALTAVKRSVKTNVRRRIRRVTRGR